MPYEAVPGWGAALGTGLTALSQQLMGLSERRRAEALAEQERQRQQQEFELRRQQIEQQMLLARTAEDRAGQRFTAEQEDRTRTNTRQSLMDVGAGGFVDPGLASQAHKLGMGGLLNEKMNPLAPAPDFMGAPGVTLPDQPFTASRRELPQEAAQRVGLEQSQFNLEQGRENASITAENRRKLEEAIAALSGGDPRLAAAVRTNTSLGSLETPEDEHTRALELARVQAGLRNQPMTRTFTGFDANGNPQFQVVPEVPGQTVTGAPPNVPTMTGGQAMQIAEMNDLLTQMGEIRAQGEKVNWGGVGPIAGPLGGFMFDWFGQGSKEEAKLRALINNLKTTIGHERFGSALTATELANLNSFIVLAERDPAAAKVRLDALEQAIKSRIAAMQGAAQMRRPGGSAPAGNPSDPMGLGISLQPGRVR